MIRTVVARTLFASTLIGFCVPLQAASLVGDLSSVFSEVDDRFGSAIAIDAGKDQNGNDVINVVAGAPLYGDPFDEGEDIGAVYLFQDGAEVNFFNGVGSPNIFYTGDFEFDEFGSSVAIDGSTIVVGTINGDHIELVPRPRTDGNGNPVKGADGEQLVDLVPEVQTPNSGYFTIIRRNPNTADWQLEGTIFLEDGATGDWLGYAVDTEDNQIVVGAPLRDLDESTPDAGLVYALTRHTDNWFDPNDEEGAVDPGVISQVLQPAGLKGSDWFGSSVAISNGTVVVGADGSDIDGPSSGAAYVFTYNQDGTWQQQARLRPSDPGSYQFFGRSVSISGNTIVVGAYLANAGKGAAYVFKRNAEGVWTQRAILTDNVGIIDDHFGSSVAVDGSLVLVGAYRYNEPVPGSVQSPSRQGTAYVFYEDITGAWNRATNIDLTALAPVADFDDFSFSVALSGYNAVIGVPKINNLSIPDNGFGMVRQVTGLDADIDTDGDGQTNDVDSDDDNDGVPDINDAFPTDPNEYSDIDRDGFGDNSDAFVFNATESFDSDNDGIGNNLDTDDDNDGFNDFTEAVNDQDPLVADPPLPADDTNSTDGETPVVAGGDSGSFDSLLLLMLGMLTALRRRFSAGQ